MRETAFAKLNLALHVRRREPDGYHRLETLFAFAEDGDLLSVAAADDLSLDVHGPFAGALGADEDNLVLRAARALRARHGLSAGAALTLDKRLPVASGIGGGSADAAAALRLLCRWWGIAADQEQLRALAAELGADVPACIASMAQRGTGRGDSLEPFDDRTLRLAPVLLVNPGLPVSTGQVFALWDGVDRGPLDAGDGLRAALSGRNDLEPAARSLAPEIEQVLEALQQMDGVVLARMSGSGATCFAVFDDISERDRAAALLTARHPGWWQLATRLRSGETATGHERNR